MNKQDLKAALADMAEDDTDVEQPAGCSCEHCTCECDDCV